MDARSTSERGYLGISCRIWVGGKKGGEGEIQKLGRICGVFEQRVHFTEGDFFGFVNANESELFRQRKFLD